MRLRRYFGAVLSLLLLVVVFSFGSSNTANAQETSQIRLSITPPVIEENANPGDTLTGPAVLVEPHTSIFSLLLPAVLLATSNWREAIFGGALLVAPY